VDIEGETRPLKEWAGQVTLVVNVASACGYTKSNYEALQPLYDKYKGQGFAVLAFPCSCFGNQEPGSDAEIRDFAQNTYGVTFPLFSKVAAVNGPDAAPVFDWLKLQKGFEADIGWNFGKYLIGRNGKPRKYYGAAWDAAIDGDVAAALAEPFDELDALR